MLELSTYIIVALSIILAFQVLLIIAEWKILVKMGDKGWKSLIPFYNRYVLFEHVWDGRVYLFVFAGIVIKTILQFITVPAALTGVITVAGAAYALICFGILGVFSLKLARSFGHDLGYAIGLILLSPIFSAILGFGQDKYQPQAQ